MLPPQDESFKQQRSHEDVTTSQQVFEIGGRRATLRIADYGATLFPSITVQVAAAYTSSGPTSHHRCRR